MGLDVKQKAALLPKPDPDDDFEIDEAPADVAAPSTTKPAAPALTPDPADDEEELEDEENE